MSREAQPFNEAGPAAAPVLGHSRKETVGESEQHLLRLLSFLYRPPPARSLVHDDLVTQGEVLKGKVTLGA
jgi:hypothetical protein